MTREKPIPKYKIEIVNELEDLLKNKKTILVTNIKNIPAAKFQEIGKKLREKAEIKVPKKSLIYRAIDNVDEDRIKLKDYIKENFAILFSDLDGFELAAELLKSKTPAKAKAGQEAPEDIEVSDGPTDLPPGPAISELGSVGLQVQIEKGKIHIKESKIIVKKGEKISQQASDVMSKLDIKPFSIGLIPLVIYDNEKNKIYTHIEIDKDKAIKELKHDYERSLAFAMSIKHFNKETIKLLIVKAASHERKLIKIITGEPDEPVSEVQEAQEETKEPKEEEKSEESTAGLASLFG